MGIDYRSEFGFCIVEDTYGEPVTKLLDIDPETLKFDRDYTDKVLLLESDFNLYIYEYPLNADGSEYQTVFWVPLCERQSTRSSYEEYRFDHNEIDECIEWLKAHHLYTFGEFRLVHYAC